MNQKIVNFKNREVAAYKLLDTLPIEGMKIDEWIVIASSYGGFEIAKIIAKTLNAEVDIMFSEKIGAPNNEECEIAVITESEEVVIHEELAYVFDISLNYIYEQSMQIYNEALCQKVNRFRGGKKIDTLKDKNVLIVDEGINTSLTMMACIKTAITLGAKSVSVAVPIVPTASIPVIESIADDLYFIEDIEHFVEINFYYDNLEEVSYEDIEKIKNEG